MITACPTPASETAPLAPVDLSPTPPINYDRVARARRTIELGLMDSDERMDVAVERMLQELMGQRLS